MLALGYPPDFFYMTVTVIGLLKAAKPDPDTSAFKFLPPAASRGDMGAEWYIAGVIMTFLMEYNRWLLPQ